MVKKLNGYLLTKNIRHKFLVEVCPFSGAKVNCMVDHVKPAISYDKPDHVILHMGADDLRSEKRVSQIARFITEQVMSLKDIDNSAIVSYIVTRHDNLNNKERNIPFISHSESTDQRRI